MKSWRTAKSARRMTNLDMQGLINLRVWAVVPVPVDSATSLATSLAIFLAGDREVGVQPVVPTFNIPWNFHLKRQFGARSRASRCRPRSAAILAQDQALNLEPLQPRARRATGKVRSACNKGFFLSNRLVRTVAEEGPLSVLPVAIATGSAHRKRPRPFRSRCRPGSMMAIRFGWLARVRVARAVRLAIFMCRFEPVSIPFFPGMATTSIARCQSALQWRLSAVRSRSQP